MPDVCSAILSDVVIFSPTPDVYWARDNFGTLASKIIQRSWGQEILIPDVNQSDAGIYECTGMNSESAAPVTQQIHVVVRCKWQISVLCTYTTTSL